MNNNQPTTGQPSSSMDGKTIAIISYLSLVGWIIAFVLYRNDKNSLGAFHLRQSLFLMLAALVIIIAQWILVFIPVLGWILSVLLTFVLLALFVLWVIGLVGAINGTEKSVPVLGAKAQQVFGTML